MEPKSLRLLLAVPPLLLAVACVESVRYTPLAPTIPQLRLPQSGAYQGAGRRGGLRPRFAWEPSSTTTSEPIRYELQYSPDPAFNTSVIEVKTLERDHRPEESLPVSAAPPVGRRYFWRVRACIQSQCSEYSARWRLEVGRSPKDFNGDGFDDLLAGLHANADGMPSQGRAFVYFGGAGTTFDSSEDGTLVGNGLESWFGYAVSSAGDFNGDGFADVLVGAPKSDVGSADAGAAYLYYGGAGDRFDATPDRILIGTEVQGQLGASVASAGDFDGDGFSDVVIGAPGARRAYLYSGGKDGDPPRPPRILTGSRIGEAFGGTVAGAGDINGDGYSDLVVSAPSYEAADSTNSCVAEVFLGKSDSLGTTHDGVFAGAAEEKCSLKAIAAGDVNGDGFSDVLAKVNGASEGARLFMGGSSISEHPTTILPLPTGSTCREVSSVGDINGDGVDDIAVVAKLSTTSAQIRIYLGKLRSSQEMIDTSPAGEITGGSSISTLFGWVVRPAGDLNGDGFDDVVTGDPSHQDNAGMMSVLFGNEGSPLDTTFDGFVISFAQLGQFAYSVAMNDDPPR